MEIGDLFVIKRRLPSYGVEPCEYASKEFRIKRFTKSQLSVYYEDRRTNNYCRCRSCSGSPQNYERCIAVSDIIITQTKKQYERNLKLKQIL